MIMMICTAKKSNTKKRCLFVETFVDKWFRHGCTGQRMGWWHGRYHGLGIAALANGWVGSMDVICCHGLRMDSTDVIILWAWMHWPMDGLVA